MKTLIYTLLVTTFVTACVKNAAKDEPSPQVKQLDLEEVTLSSGQIQNGEDIELSHKAKDPAFKINQTWSFSLDEISELQLQRGPISNKDCLANDPFVSDYNLVDEAGNSSLLRRHGGGKLLLPGKYKILASVENGSLCREVSMKFKLDVKKREDLVLTENVDRGYRCFTARENGEILRNSFVNVSTYPIDVKKITPLAGGDTQVSPIIDETNICQHKLPKNFTCEASITPAVKREGPISSKNRVCKGPDAQERVRAKADFLVFKKQSAAQARINCEFKRRVIDLKLEDCSLMYNFGVPLPVVKGETSIIVRPGQIHLEFELEEGRSLQHLPHPLFVNIMVRDVHSNYRELLRDYQILDRRDFIDGHVRIVETGIRRLIQNFQPESLKIVFSRNKRPVSGIYSLSLKETCDKDSESIVVLNQGRPDSFCAQDEQ